MLLSMKKYAASRKRRGLVGGSVQAVSMAVRTGRIHTTPDGKIDPRAADRDWLANSRVRVVHSKNGGDMVYLRARAEGEVYRARLAKQAYEQRQNVLIQRDQVEANAFAKGRILRDNLLNLPGRLAAIIAAEPDAGKIHALLTTELRGALAEL